MRRRLLLFHDSGSLSAMTAFQETNSETQLGTAWLLSQLLGSLLYWKYTFMTDVFLVMLKLNMRYGCGHESSRCSFLWQAFLELMKQ